MAALLLLILAVAGGVVVADLVWENTTADQITLFHHTVSGYPQGWLLAIAAGLGALVALLLVASLNATKGRRMRRAQLRRLRRGPEQAPRHLAGPNKPAEPRGDGRESRAQAHQSPGTPQQVNRHPEPLYEQARRAAGRDNDWELPLPATQGRRR